MIPTEYYRGHNGWRVIDYFGDVRVQNAAGHAPGGDSLCHVRDCNNREYRGVFPMEQLASAIALAEQIDGDPAHPIRVALADRAVVDAMFP